MAATRIIEAVSRAVTATSNWGKEAREQTALALRGCRRNQMIVLALLVGSILWLLKYRFKDRFLRGYGLFFLILLVYASNKSCLWHSGFDVRRRVQSVEPCPMGNARLVLFVISVCA